MKADVSIWKLCAHKFNLSTFVRQCNVSICVLQLIYDTQMASTESRVPKSFSKYSSRLPRPSPWEPLASTPQPSAHSWRQKHRDKQTTCLWFPPCHIGSTQLQITDWGETGVCISVGSSAALSHVLSDTAQPSGFTADWSTLFRTETEGYKPQADCSADSPAKIKRNCLKRGKREWQSGWKRERERDDRRKRHRRWYFDIYHEAVQQAVAVVSLN